MTQGVSLDLELGKNNFLEMTKENTNLVSEISNAFSKAVNKGVGLVELPPDYKDAVTTEVKKQIGKKRVQK